MNVTELLNPETQTRHLLRALRRSANYDDGVELPESVAWHIYMELRRREEPTASSAFLTTIKGLHSRRSLAGVHLPVADSDPDEHRMVDDPFLADLWKAYKKCIRTNRTGPAAQLLVDIEEQIAAK